MFIVPLSRDSRAFASAARFVISSDNATRSPALDLAESNLAYTARLDVPGVSKDDVKVVVEGRRVTVQAQSTAQAQESEHTDAAKADSGSDRIVYRERGASSYARSFTLPAEVDHAQTQARLENGVLTLTLPKRGARAPVHVTVN